MQKVWEFNSNCDKDELLNTYIIDLLVMVIKSNNDDQINPSIALGLLSVRYVRYSQGGGGERVKKFASVICTVTV